MARCPTTFLIGLLCSLSLYAVPVWAEDGSAFARLPLAERSALAPLAAEWAAMQEADRAVWRGIAERFEQWLPGEQQRIHARMREWAQLPQEERERARDQYRRLRSMSPEERERLGEQWQAYQRAQESAAPSSE